MRAFATYFPGKQNCLFEGWYDVLTYYDQISIYFTVVRESTKCHLVYSTSLRRNYPVECLHRIVPNNFWYHLGWTKSEFVEVWKNWALSSSQTVVWRRCWPSIALNHVGQHPLSWQSCPRCHRRGNGQLSVSKWVMSAMPWLHGQMSWIWHVLGKSVGNRRPDSF